jgi:hypothetical protein
MRVPAGSAISLVREQQLKTGNQDPVQVQYSYSSRARSRSGRGVVFRQASGRGRLALHKTSVGRGRGEKGVCFLRGPTRQGVIRRATGRESECLSAIYEPWALACSVRVLGCAVAAESPTPCQCRRVVPYSPRSLSRFSWAGRLTGSKGASRALSD